MAARAGPPPLDRWKYYAVTHADLDVMNPIGKSALRRVLKRIELPPAARVLDMGCGKGWLLVELVAGHRDRLGVGVDLSPYSARDARTRVRGACDPPPSIAVKCMDGALYRPPKAHSFDLAGCLGASWIFGGFRGTLRALRAMVKPGGYLLVGEPFWTRPPPAGYLRAVGERRDAFTTRLGTVRAAKALGLELALAIDATARDWQFYEGSQWNAALRFAARNPEDTDVAAILARVRRERDAHLRWGLDCLGWGVFLLKAPPQARAAPAGNVKGPGAPRAPGKVTASRGPPRA